MAREPNMTLRIRSAECLGPDRGRRRTDQGGRVLDYLGKPNRKMCSLYLSMLDRFGIRLKEFGDAQDRLEEL